MNILLYILICLFSVYFWYQRKYGERNKILAKIPSPSAWPLLCHAPSFLFKSRDEIFSTVQHLIQTQPSIFRLDMSIFYSIIYVRDLKMTEAILSSMKFIDKSNFYDTYLADWLGFGLLISKGQKWHQRRKIITPAFHFKILEQFVEMMDRHGDIFVEKLKKIDGKEVDIFPLISLYALDVICGKFQLKNF